jgi:hypothetical protein
MTIVADMKQPRHGQLAAMALGALGVVHGDIGTSPLFQVRAAHQPCFTQIVERWSAFPPSVVAAPIVCSLHPAVKIFATMRAFLRVIGLPASSAGNRAAVWLRERPHPRRLLLFPDLATQGGTVGTADEWLTAQPPGSRLAALETT